MKRNSLAIGLAVALFALVMGALSQDVTKGKEFTISTTSRLVLLDVSVRDSAGGFVSGLSKENFEVAEDGKKQEITQFSNVDAPVTVGILVDESGSMRRKKPEAITAALGFISSSNPHDEIFVLNFNEKVHRGLPDTKLFSDDAKQLRAALSRTDPIGRTALYDAIMSGLRQLEMGREDKKTLLLISDGGDNVSSANLKDVKSAVLQTVATIYTVGVFDSDDPDKNPEVLKNLAQVSGGEAYFPPKLDDVIPICRKIAKDVRTRYSIGYVPSVDDHHRVRHIKVTARAPGHGKLIARTRTSYLMNEQTGTADREKK
jgi:Ca-activated chloride channel family protein